MRLLPANVIHSYMGGIGSQREEAVVQLHPSLSVEKCGTDKVIKTECSRVPLGDFGHEQQYHCCSLSCSGAFKCFLIKIGESSPANSDTPFVMILLFNTCAFDLESP